MNVQVTSRPTVQPAATSKLAIADGDIHPQRNSYKDLFPYMEARWVEHVRRPSARARARRIRRDRPIRRASPNASRRDAWPPEGGRPGSSLSFLQKQLLDENNIQLGILNPTGDNGASFQNREFGAGVASAMNRWVEAEWLIRAAPERLHRGAVRGRRCRRRRDRALGRRSALRPGADGDPHRQPARPEAVLEDLRGRRRGRPAGRCARLRLRRLSGHRQRLAVVLHRGHGRPRPVRADPSSPAW